MRTIYKFPIPALTREQVIDVPHNFNPLAVQMQGATITLWGEVETDNAMRKLAVFIVGTGHPLPDEPCTYVGTVQTIGGTLIWHVYIADKYEDMQ